MDILILTAIAFTVTSLATPLTIILANKYGLVDDPKLRPHPAHTQKRVIPRAGGLPIYLGIFLSSLLFLPVGKYLVGILAGITVLLVVGLIDDKKVHFSPYLRLSLLFLAAILAVGSGIGIAFITNPLQGFPLLPPEYTGPSIIHFDQTIADIFALFWIIALTQIVNWSKGVDGQMPGITAIASLTLGLLSLKFYLQGDLQQLDIAKLAFITFGTSFAFLIFNWHPAKIIPGFSGSTILAFMLATLAILSGAKVATALLVLAIPTIDFIYTFLRRIYQGKSPVWGDRGHLHHRLLDNLGWSHQKISLFYILGSVILGAIALVDTSNKLFIILAVAVLFLGFILWINSFGGSSKAPDQDNG